MSKDLEIDWSEATRSYIKTSFIETPPVHPDYTVKMNPRLKKGDLVETHDLKIGLVLGIEESDLNIQIYINGADNKYYKIMVGQEEKVYVGYSLKKIEKKT